ncbi:MAG TPA: GAF domain-containing SpoIIE family protein phosphatase, partial [Acidimicrobiales bacterium]|nr:GAF domain-containing SpoIIE family protein phosphatase [Acidimicrobiales bacterium]
GLVEPDGWVRMVAMRSGFAFDRRRWERVAPWSALPVAEAIRSAATVVRVGKEAVVAQWPDLAGGALADDVCVLAVPLLAGGTALGALGIVVPVAAAPGDLQLRYLEALTEASAQAVERLAAHAAAAEAADRLEFLAQVSEVLAGSLDYEDTLRAVADLAVPRLADWCAIDLLEDGRLRRVAVSHVDPAKVRYAWELWERYPTDLDAPTGAGAVLRTGVTELIEAVDDAVLDAAGLAPELRRIVAELQIVSGVTVALTARGRTLGVLSLIHAESGRRYRPDDVRFAEDVARRAAVAIDNAQLHTETLQVALQLQRAVLPTSFDDADGWRVAVHYRPAGRSEVGGDFFDAVTLPDGRLAVCVGDVMGRGVAAAAAMAQLRAAVRAYVALDPEPDVVVGRLEHMFTLLGLAQLVTMVYGLVDAGAGVGRWHAAGHLPPLVVAADGEVRRMVLDPSPPFGAGAHERAVTEVPFGPADIVVCYSDGLVERRGEDLDEGLRRLERAAGGLISGLSDAALAGLADDLRQQGHDDDVTVLAFRRLAPGSPQAPAAAAGTEG